MRTDPHGLTSTPSQGVTPQGVDGRRESSTTTLQRFLARKLSSSILYGLRGDDAEGNIETIDMAAEIGRRLGGTI
jgi:hypothetical protein